MEEDISFAGERRFISRSDFLLIENSKKRHTDGEICVVFFQKTRGYDVDIICVEEKIQGIKCNSFRWSQ